MGYVATPFGKALLALRPFTTEFSLICVAMSIGNAVAAIVRVGPVLATERGEASAKAACWASVSGTGVTPDENAPSAKVQPMTTCIPAGASCALAACAAVRKEHSERASPSGGEQNPVTFPVVSSSA